MQLTEVMRMVTYITMIYRMHRAGKTQGGREAQSPGCTQNTLIYPSRRPPIPIALDRGFVALRRETVTGGDNERARFERVEAKNGNTPLFRMHVL